MKWEDIVIKTWIRYPRLRRPITLGVSLLTKLMRFVTPPIRPIHWWNWLIWRWRDDGVLLQQAVDIAAVSKKCVAIRGNRVYRIRESITISGGAGIKGIDTDGIKGVGTESPTIEWRE